MRAEKQSSFDALVEYILDEQSKNERVGYVGISNCEFDTPERATVEILNTQTQNKRAASDKTYHLIVSFRAGEQPDDATLKAIEARICAGLGYGEHQRISCVHHDTDNLHIHIAINKIHPTRYSIHNPYYDHTTLPQLCDKLENEYGLQKDNHQPQQLGAQNRASDMERHAGVESLLGWIKRECQDQIAGAKSWSELHEVMQSNGLELHAQGNGLVISAQDGTTVKASSIGRDFSKSKLEARFGAFEQPPAPKAGARPSKTYTKKPMRSRVNTVELYAAYQNEQRNSTNLRAGEFRKAIAHKNRLIEDAKRSGNLKRAAIKLVKGAGPGKRVMYAATSKTTKFNIEAINKEYLKERQAIYAKYQRRAWADWLRVKATEGDQEALAALRARDAAQGVKGNTVSGKAGQGPQRSAHTHQDSVTKKGTIIYQAGETTVRDDGGKLNVSRGATQAGLQQALRMAMERYGNRITVNGTDAFKEQIAQAAAAAQLPITFHDAAIERRHQELLNQVKKKEKTYDEHNRSRADGGGTVGAGAGVDGRATTGVHEGGLSARESRPSRRTLVPGGGIPGKPNIGGVGSKPPPRAKNHLRRLSQLDVVRIASGGEMLLPGHVSNQLEHQGAKPDNSLRRDIPGAGQLSQARAAAALYIAEREAKRLNSFDIPKHTLYNLGGDGVVVFAGIRQIEGQKLALLKRGEEVMVLPIDEVAAGRLKRVKVGSEINVTKEGSIKLKGRGR